MGCARRAHRIDRSPNTGPVDSFSGRPVARAHLVSQNGLVRFAWPSLPTAPGASVCG